MGGINEYLFILWYWLPLFIEYTRRSFVFYQVPFLPVVARLALEPKVFLVETYFRINDVFFREVLDMVYNVAWPFAAYFAHTSIDHDASVNVCTPRRLPFRRVIEFFCKLFRHVFLWGAVHAAPRV